MLESTAPNKIKNNMISADNELRLIILDVFLDLKNL